MKHVLLVVTLVLSAPWPRCQAQESGPKASPGVANAAAPSGATGSSRTTCGSNMFDLASGSWMSVQRLLGTRVTNPLGDDVGDITDVLLDRRGYVAGIVIQVGGFMGIGGQSVTMGLDKVRIISGTASRPLTVTVFDTRDHILNARKQPEPPGGQ